MFMYIFIFIYTDILCSKRAVGYGARGYGYGFTRVLLHLI